MADGWQRFAPARYAGAHVDTLADAARADLGAWMDADPTPNLLVLGPVGTGKTYTLWAMARELYWRRYRVVVSRPAEVLRRMREEMDEPAPGPPMSSLLRQADVVMLDDMGTERVTDWGWDQIYSALDQRWEAMLPTVVSSNLPVPELRQAWGERMSSRLLNQDTVVLKLGGKDRRRHP